MNGIIGIGIAIELLVFAWLVHRMACITAARKERERLASLHNPEPVSGTAEAWTELFAGIQTARRERDLQAGTYRHSWARADAERLGRIILDDPVPIVVGTDWADGRPSTSRRATSNERGWLLGFVRDFSTGRINVLAPSGFLQYASRERDIIAIARANEYRLRRAREIREFQEFQKTNPPH